MDLICRCIGELGCREANTAVCDVEDVVETLEERHAVDEVEAFTAQTAQVVHDEVHRVGLSADCSVELQQISTLQYGKIWNSSDRLTARGQICAFGVNSNVVCGGSNG